MRSSRWISFLAAMSVLFASGALYYSHATDSDQLDVQLETLVTDVESTEQTVRQVEALFQSGEDLWQH